MNKLCANVMNVAIGKKCSVIINDITFYECLFSLLKDNKIQVVHSRFLGNNTDSLRFL